MIERYTLPEMKKIWEPHNRFQKWLDIEVAACEALAELGEIPRDAVQTIKEKADFDVNRIDEIEAEVRHDVIAFLTNVKEYVGDAAKYIHLGLTSSDILDTSLSIMMREASDILLENLQDLKQVLLKKAKDYKYTPMIGRTHGIHAEPITFGIRMALWVDEVERNIVRLQQARETISFGKISGAVGTYANIDPKIEAYVCEKLGLTPAKASTQVLQRDRHAQYMTTLAVIASSLDKFATEIRNMQRTDILEAEERFYKGQKGSSAMPHKRNPITCERVAGLSRVIRGNAVAALENVSLWHERDITHSSVERVIIPDSTILLNYMLDKMINIMDNLIVYPENMEANINKTKGLIFSQRVLLTLIGKGMNREDAYRIVQRDAMATWEGEGTFKAHLLDDEEVLAYLNKEEIEGCFDYSYHLKNVDTIMARFGL